jgi:hypothetical protein
MAELKTKATSVSVADFLNAIPDAQIREDCWTIAKMMRAATKAEPKMWGPSIVGFGDYRYVYPDGREMDWMQVAFSPRKQNITLYIEQDAELLAKLGVHSCGKGCLYVKRLSDVDLPILTKMVRASVKHKMKKK